MFQRWLAPRTELVYGAMRIVLGLLFAFHGVQKVFGVLRDSTPSLFRQIWWGGVIELVCGMAVALGLFTRGAAFLASGTMAVAYVQFHWEFQGGANFFPAMNKGELALVYAFVFLFIACRGAGKWSLDERGAAPSN
jgi:putative oxidoreductase